MRCEAQLRKCLWCFTAGSYEFAVIGFHYVEPEEEGSSKVDRIKGGSYQVLSHIMGTVEQASYKARTNSVAETHEFWFFLFVCLNQIEWKL